MTRAARNPRENEITLKNSEYLDVSREVLSENAPPYSTFSFEV